MLNDFIMAVPPDQRMTRLINAPKVDEFALSSRSYVFGVLPFYFEASEVRVEVLMIEASDLSTVRGFAVPDIDLAHEASCRD